MKKTCNEKSGNEKTMKKMVVKKINGRTCNEKTMKKMVMKIMKKLVIKKN